jgi:hypothetical protein
VSLPTEEGLQPVTEEDVMLTPFISMPVEVPEIDADEPNEPSGPDDVSEFDRRHREPFTGLLFLGQLTKTVEHYGHSFEIQTPTQREKIEAGLLHKPYVGSISSEIAWAALSLATYLVSIDGQPLPEPIGPSAKTKVKDRFEWVLDNLHHDIIEVLFTDCLELDSDVNRVLDELERLTKS